MEIKVTLDSLEQKVTVDPMEKMDQLVSLDPQGHKAILELQVQQESLECVVYRECLGLRAQKGHVVYLDHRAFQASKDCLAIQGTQVSLETRDRRVL
jgi:hypothetical protein